MDNLLKTIYFDLRMLNMRGISTWHRIQFLMHKYSALLQVAVSGRGYFKIRHNRFTVSSFSEIGTIHSSIVDFYDDIVASKVLPLKSAPRIVDVGANIGQFSNAALFFFPQAEIVAFEPDPLIYKKYQANINGNKQSVTIHNCGLGSSESKKLFYRHKLSGMSSFVKPPTANIESTTTLSIRTLDSFDFKSLNLLKIDVEGFEYDVLAGAKRVLMHADYLLLELSLKRTTKFTNLRILELLKSLNQNAQLIKFGRPLGNKSRPECQDVLLMLKVPGAGDRNEL